MKNGIEHIYNDGFKAISISNNIIKENYNMTILEIVIYTITTNATGRKYTCKCNHALVHLIAFHFIGILYEKVHPLVMVAIIILATCISGVSVMYIAREHCKYKPRVGTYRYHLSMSPVGKSVSGEVCCLTCLPIRPSSSADELVTIQNSLPCDDHEVNNLLIIFIKITSFFI